MLSIFLTVVKEERFLLVVKDSIVVSKRSPKPSVTSKIADVKVAISTSATFLIKVFNIASLVIFPIAISADTAFSNFNAILAASVVVTIEAFPIFILSNETSSGVVKAVSIALDRDNISDRITEEVAVSTLMLDCTSFISLNITSEVVV